MFLDFGILHSNLRTSPPTDRAKSLPPSLIHPLHLIQLLTPTRNDFEWLVFNMLSFF